MTDELYNKKLADLQKHIPFMETMIVQLKDPKWKPREAQLNKMESLYNMITDRNKKWKFETLLKCEEVILKLQSKVKANRPIFPAETKKEHFMNPERPDTVTNTVNDIMNALKFNNARAKLNCEMVTPKSPSPMRDDLPPHAPKIIPFEATNEPIRKSTNIVDPNELSVTWNNDKQDRYVNERPDIYASAAKSLGVIPPAKVSIFDRLGPVVPDVPEKPLLSNADLEMLSAGDDFVIICQNDTQTARQQSPPKQEKHLPDLNLKISARIAPVPASKPKVGLNESPPVVKDPRKHSSKRSEKEDKVLKQPEPSKGKTQLQSQNKSEKLVTTKAPDIFGSCLSSIDNMILEDSKKKDKKKEERRYSGEHKTEKHHHHDSKHHHKHKEKDKRHDEKMSKRCDPRQKIDSKDKTSKDALPLPSEKTNEIVETKEKTQEIKQVVTSSENLGGKPKRLADKYNPKPRKTSLDVEIPSSKPVEINNFEKRDPRRRLGILGNPPSLLGNPPSLLGNAPLILGNPAFPQPVPPPALGNQLNLNSVIPAAIPVLTNFMAPAVQQSTPSPTQPPPLMQLNLPPHQDYQSPPMQQMQPSWLGENHQEFARPVFEPPQKHIDPRTRQFHLDNQERVSGDPRRQPRFSPPPHISPVHAPQFQNNFAPNIYPNQPTRNDFVPPPLQRNHFEPPTVVPVNNRFEPPRFDAPPQQKNQNNMSRKSFCPFEPLNSGREGISGAPNHFSGDNFRRNDSGGGTRTNFGGYGSNRFERISDRYARKVPRDNLKTIHRDQDQFSKDKFKPPQKEFTKPEEESRVKSETGMAHTKYDEIYSKLDVEKEVFSSPLESLYASSKVDIKSSIQSFKIPKKPKPDPPAQPATPPVVEESKSKPAKIEVKAEKLQQTEKDVETKENYTSAEHSLVEESDDADDTPLFRRIRSRTKIQNKKNIIDDTDEEEDENEIEGEEDNEGSEQSNNVVKRSTRQSAIIANRLIRKKSGWTVNKNKKGKLRQKKNTTKNADVKDDSVGTAKPKIENDEKSVDEKLKIEDEKPEIEDERPATLDKIETIEAEVKKEEDLTRAVLEAKAIEEKDSKEDIVKEESKEADPVQKAKDELLNEAKRKKLNLNDQGADVLQFILMNYKKIKKIFKSDSSSEDEEKEKKKKKKKKREKSSSSSSSSSDDEKSTKEKKKLHQNKEKANSEEDGDKNTNKEWDGKTKNKKEEKLPVPNAEIKEDDVVPEMPEEKKVVAEAPEKKEEDSQIAIPNVIPKVAPKKIKKIPPRKGKLIRKKFPGRITRNQALQAASSPTKKARRSELDKLHDDIKEMLMGSEVLTSTGKRACTMPKDDSEESRKGDSTEDQSTTSLEQSFAPIPVKSASLRVLIEKTDIEKLLTKEALKVEVTEETNEEDPPILPKLDQIETATSNNKVNRRKFLRKKKHRWASGFIKRKNRRKLSNSEDNNKSLNSTLPHEIEQDKLHTKDYFVDGPKSFCKLCSFKGRLIVQHYKSAHPHSEVLISRIDPQTTEHLIREAKLNHYESIVLEETTAIRKRRFGFKCPFNCLVGTTVDTFDNYYDHITSHTGEHRYFCPHCSFSTTNPRNLRAHMVPQHNANLEHHGKPKVPAPPPSEYAFGFVCAQCHYVQTRRERLESHVENYHGNEAEIVKINLSLICKVHEDVPVTFNEERSQKKQVHINECIESVVHGAGIVKIAQPALVKNLNIFELMSQIGAEEEEEPPVLVKMELDDPGPELDALIPEIQLEESQISRPKDPDLTVFMCQSELQMDDEQNIEEKRLKKMNEIQESCRSSRTSIVDKLQSRLENQETFENDSAPSCGSPILVSSLTKGLQPPPLIPIVAADRSKKSLDSLPKNIVSTEVVMGPKKLAPISSIINRLQDKLLPTPTNGNTKQISPSTVSQDSQSCPSPEKDRINTSAIPNVIAIGPVSVTFNNNLNILYSCFIPFCVFTTVDSTSYEKHCKESHADFVYSQTKCDHCQIKIDKEEDYVSMHDIYRHIRTCHADFFENRGEKITNAVNSDGDCAGNDMPEDIPNVISQAEDNTSTGAKYPFKITNVTSVESDVGSDSEKSNTGKKYPFVIANVTSGGGTEGGTSNEEKQAATRFSLPHEVPNLISQADDRFGPKFPFIITSVTSLAKKPISNPLPTTTAISATSIVSDSFQITTLPAASAIQTSPIVKPYTIATISASPSMVPVILNHSLGYEPQKLQLPVISRVQSLAPARKDIKIRPVPLKQLTSAAATPTSSSTAADRVGMINSVTLKTGEGTTVTLKDIALNMQERSESPKSKLAGKAMLTTDIVMKFYKCPQYYCTFAADKSQELVKHLTYHTELNNLYVRCLYCDYKTLYNKYVLHLEIQHTNCDYACGRCFYRATNASFVHAHNRLVHKDEPIVLKTARENMPARIAPQKLLPIRSILKHYMCGVTGCTFKTVFTEAFTEHQQIAHPGMTKSVCRYCGSIQAHLLSHWAGHGVHPFHCRYCPVGSYSMEVVVNHQSLIHAKMDYCIILRKFIPNPNFPERTALSYRVDDDATYDRLFILYGGCSATNNTTVAPVENLPEQINLPPTEDHPDISDSDSMFFEVDLTSSGDSRDDAVHTETPLTIGNLAENIITSYEPEIAIVDENLDAADKDPLSFDVADNTENVSDGFDSNDDKELDLDAGKYDPKAVKYNEEYTGAMLYKCVCNVGFEDKIKFKHHVAACQSDKAYKCAHCGVVRKSPKTLLMHLNVHGRKRFKCSLCQYKHFSKRFVRDHLNVDHNVHEMMVLPATVSKKIDYSNDDFVLRPKLSPVKRIGSMAPVAEQLGTSKTVFSPRESDQLPRQPIYQTDVFCAVCNYATKVKSNMVRHLQAHQNDKAVPESAPVNPVPCLEKSEKMFDKMVNLALSSHSGGKMGGTPKAEKVEEVRVPNFVPINKRFVCGADSCNYLCPEEGMLRRHLTIFHSQELNYTCLHCKSKLFEEKIINVEAILKHLKLHDNHLYGCGLCKFIHNLRHKVERHLSDKHQDNTTSFIIFREIGKEAEAETRAVEKEESKKCWRCGMCKFRSVTVEDVKVHAQSKHNVHAQNKCALCEFGSEDVGCFAKHFEVNHSGQNIDVVVTFYKEDEVKQQKQDVDAEFNTTPLWQRNKNIKHIRGILLEETNNKVAKTTGTKKAKTLKWKKLELAKEELKNEISANANKRDNLTPKETSQKQSIITSDPISTSIKSSDAKKPGAKQLMVPSDSILSSNKPSEIRKFGSKQSTPTPDPILSPNKPSETKNPGSKQSILISDQIFSNELSEFEKPEPSPLIIISESASPSIKSSETKKPGAKRKKPRTKIPLAARIDSRRTVPKGVNADDEVILLTLSDEDNSGELEVINVDEIEEREDGKVPKAKQGIVVLSDHKLDVSEVQKNDLIVDLDPDEALNPIQTLMCTENIKDVTILSEAPNSFATLTPLPPKKPKKDSTAQRNDIIEIMDEKNDDRDESIANTTENKLEEVPQVEISIAKPAKLFGTCEIIEVSSSEDMLESQKEDISTEKIDKSISEVLESCKLTFDESSSDDSDMLEIPTENTKETRTKSPAPGVIASEDAKKPDSPAQNVKESENATREDKTDKSSNEDLLSEDDIPLKKLKLDISLGEIETMGKAELTEGSFVGTYGPYGVPWNGNYMCPLCEKFVTISNKEFTSHIYRELQYGIYKCASCDYRDSTKATVVKHHRDTHKGVEEGERAILSPDQQIIDWVEKLIIFQTRILTLEKEQLSDALYYCHFCDYKNVSASDLRKHQARHWTVLPFACNTCNFKAVSRGVMKNHIKRCHPGGNATIKETDLRGEVVIKRTRISPRAEKPEDATDDETLETDCDLDFNLESLKDVLLSCGYCRHRQKLPELKKHFKERHPLDKFRVYRYRCNFCTSTFMSSLTLDQHFIACHYGMRRCFSQADETSGRYGCPECYVSDDTLFYLKEHLRTHFKMIKCKHCDLKTVYWKTMRKHYRENHPEENFEFIYLTSQEKLYEQAVNNIAVNTGHCGYSASGSNGSSNKKRKHLDEDSVNSDDTNANYREKPAKAIKCKQVARKSTGGYRKSDMSSSKQSHSTDLSTIMTTIDVMGASVTMDTVQLSRILNMNPVVVIEDCETNL